MAATTEGPELHGQLRLDEYARATDPDTSVDAAASMTLSVRNVECQRAFDVIAGAGEYGATVPEIIAQTHNDRGNTSRRVTDLCRAGRIVDSGRRRLGTSGRSCIVWVAC